VVVRDTFEQGIRNMGLPNNCLKGLRAVLSC
jgi:hypothetical protein